MATISKARMPYERALELAVEIEEMLALYCERIEIAGSIRRKAETVGDIEIVAIPKMRPDGQVDMFTGETRYTSALDDKLRKIEHWQPIKNGNHYKQFDIGPCNLDLFVTTPEKWGVIFTIRTGSAEFSHRLVTQRQYGGLCPSHFNFADGRIWSSGEALATPEEIDVFRTLGLEWIRPEDRR